MRWIITLAPSPHFTFTEDTSPLVQFKNFKISDSFSLLGRCSCKVLFYAASHCFDLRAIHRGKSRECTFAKVEFWHDEQQQEFGEPRNQGNQEETKKMKNEKRKDKQRQEELW